MGSRYYLEGDTKVLNQSVRNILYFDISNLSNYTHNNCACHSNKYYLYKTKIKGNPLKFNQATMNSKHLLS